jgi:hypothetical protein
VIEHDVPECLQREGTRVMLAGFGLWQIDHPVGQVGHRASAFRQVRRVQQSKTQVRRHPSTTCRVMGPSS